MEEEGAAGSHIRLHEVGADESGENGSRSCFSNTKTFTKRHWKKAVGLCVSVVLTVLATVLGLQQSGSTTVVNNQPQDQPDAGGRQELLGGMLEGKSSLDFGVRMDSQLQDCQDTNWKRSFPNLDYALLGYDILQGYPLAEGHDPGLTHPIFLADYSGGRQTSDCRYSVPSGFLVVPDVSCVTSFSSKLIKNKLDMSRSLDVSAHVEGGGWGVSFSASTSYKQSVSQMSSGEFLFVLSQAICHYYYSSLDLTSPPPFHPGFLRWAARLAEPDATQSDVIRFVKYYGTHFLSEVTFGARFVKKHKVSKTNYEELKSSKFSVEAQASYSGAFDVGGGFSMGTKQRSAVAKFQESVETSTVTVGAAPPSNGDALTWAATVQDNPVPSKYSLTPIHELFTETFAQSFNFDLSVVRERLQNASSLYCQYLKKRGAVRTCEDQTSVEGWETILAGVYIPNQGYTTVRYTGQEDCKLLCLQEESCVAVDIWPRDDEVICSFYDGTQNIRVQRQAGRRVVVFLPTLQRLRRNFVMKQTRIQNIVSPPRSLTAATTSDCSQKCAEFADCHAFVMCNRGKEDSWCKSTKGNCYLYNKEGIDTVTPDPNSETHFVWKNFTNAINSL